MTLNEGSSRLQRFIQREPENAKDRHAVALTEENERIVHVGQAGTKVGPDQLGPPVRVGSTRIDSDRLGSNKKINKIGLGSTRIIKKTTQIIKRKVKSVGIT